MTTEQNQDATSYIEAAIASCKRRLGLLAASYSRGVHTTEEYEWLCDEVIAETEETWNVFLPDLR